VRAALVAAALALAACETRDTFVTPTPGWQRMLRQDRIDAYEPLRDGRMGRPPAGTVSADSVDVVVLPRWDLAMLRRGAERFAIDCRPCHGVTGHADTPVASYMELRPPADLHEPRVVALPDAGILRVIREGYGAMPSYADRLSVLDAWAVVGHVRALQLSEAARLDELPAWARAQALGTLP
jgi:mono/diheme cytochrome c family protein